MRLLQKAVPVRMAVVALAMVVPVRAVAGDVVDSDIDTEHIFGFMIGSDIGSVGEREFQAQTGARLAKAAGRYRLGEQEFELEWVPAKDVRFEIGSALAAYHIDGVAGLANSRGMAWQGASIDMRYRFLDRATMPVGFTLAFDGEFSRIDDISAAPTHGYRAGVTLAFDRDILSGSAVTALNLIYQPEWTRHLDDGRVERSAVLGASWGLMMQAAAGVLVGAEAQYLRRYEGLGLEDLAGQALFIGPTAFFSLPNRSRLTASWSMQVWGRPASPGTSLDLVNFERHQARLTYGINF